jgi:hypothetical protein
MESPGAMKDAMRYAFVYGNLAADDWCRAGMGFEMMLDQKEEVAGSKLVGMATEAMFSLRMTKSRRRSV